jgi:uncharacterized protein YjiS (DUF1127 family)
MITALAIQSRPVFRGQTFMGMARRAFGLWRERSHARAALTGMTARELADIGLTACDRGMALSVRDWFDPDSHRNITIPDRNPFKGTPT